MAALRARKTRLETGFVAIDPGSRHVRACMGVCESKLDVVPSLALGNARPSVSARRTTSTPPRWLAIRIRTLRTVLCRTAIAIQATTTISTMRRPASAVRSSAASRFRQ
jgi:hypothetical protein